MRGRRSYTLQGTIVIAALLTAACTSTPFSPSDMYQPLTSYCPGDPTEWPKARTFELTEDGPPGMLSPRQALQRAKQAAEDQLLRFRSASFRFDPCYTLLQPLGATREPAPRQVWKVNMRGVFEYDGWCTAGWLIILDARTGRVYLSGESRLFSPEVNCSAAG